MQVPHQLDIAFTQPAPRPLALDRVVWMCRSRGHEIAALEFDAGDAGRPGSARLTVVGDASRLQLLLCRLAGLIDVASVAVRGDDGRQPQPPM